MLAKKLFLTISFIFFTQNSCMDMPWLPIETKTAIAYNCDSLADCAAFIATCKENANNISILDCILQNPTSLLHPNYTEALVHYAQPCVSNHTYPLMIDESSIDYKKFASIIAAGNPDNQKERMDMIGFCSSNTGCKDTTTTDTIKTYLTRDCAIYNRAIVPLNITALKTVIINQYLNDMKSVNHLDQTELLDALSCQRNQNLIFLLLKYSKDNINLKDKTGNTALHYACLYRNGQIAVDIAKRLISYKCDVNITNNRKSTPLHIALSTLRNKKKNIDLAKLLVEHGAATDIKTLKSGNPTIETLSVRDQKLLLSAAQKRKQPDSGHDNTGESAAKRSRK